MKKFKLNILVLRRYVRLRLICVANRRFLAHTGEDPFVSLQDVPDGFACRECVLDGFEDLGQCEKFITQWGETERLVIFFLAGESGLKHLSAFVPFHKNKPILGILDINNGRVWNQNKDGKKFLLPVDSYPKIRTSAFGIHIFAEFPILAERDQILDQNKKVWNRYLIELNVLKIAYFR